MNLLSIAFGTDIPYFRPPVTDDANIHPQEPTNTPQPANHTHTFQETPIREDSLSLLPTELLWAIFDELTLTELLPLMQANQHLYQVIQSYLEHSTINYQAIWNEAIQHLWQAIESITCAFREGQQTQIFNPIDSFQLAELAFEMRHHWPKKYIQRLLTPQQQHLLYAGAPLWLIMMNEKSETPYSELIQVTTNECLAMAFFIARPSTPFTQIQTLQGNIYDQLNQNIAYEITLQQSPNGQQEAHLHPIFIEYLFIQNHWNKGKGLKYNSHYPNWLIAQKNLDQLCFFLTHITSLDLSIVLKMLYKSESTAQETSTAAIIQGVLNLYPKQGFSNSTSETIRKAHLQALETLQHLIDPFLISHAQE